MNKRRLLKLADLLEADAKNKKGIKFDLEKWGYVPKLNELEEPETVKIGCNTTACAIGLACISGAFKRSGLTHNIASKSAHGGNNIVPLCNGYKDFDAVEFFFDLSPIEASFLFENHNYPSQNRRAARGERAVAKRIRNFVAGKASP